MADAYTVHTPARHDPARHEPACHQHTTDAHLLHRRPVHARGRDWVVLGQSLPEVLQVRPLQGTEEEATELFLPIEGVRGAVFDLPDPNRPGDFRSSRLLRDAVRLSVRSSAGPFRSFARISVEPRPYQLVPLLLALKQDPVRLLIADDVGVGKTIEACLIAREMLDRGEVQRLAILCPPHLAEQWQDELASKFHLQAECVLASTAERLERTCNIGESVFERYPIVVVSTDFVKSERRRQEFLRARPELVIVDEAHTSAWDGATRGSRHQRHRLLKELAADRARHLLLITATPHSGNEDAFRSLLGLLSPELEHLPSDLSGKENEAHRRRLASHFVQRRRGDIVRYLHLETPFPEREEAEVSYTLSPGYRALFDRALAYARESVQDASGTKHQQRIRWWSALALLRAPASSPVAAAATLRRRAAVADTDSPEEADALGQRTLLDLSDDEAAERLDVSPGSDVEPDSAEQTRQRRRLRDMAAEAEALRGDADQKRVTLVKHLHEMVRGGFRPIVFCRFIDTADYLAGELRKRLKEVEIVAVTGSLPPSEREARVLELAQSPRRLLVATDCLSEGINLQEHFDAVVHYDLSWNPTRHEQREGRTDRFGQPSSKVRMLTYYGIDNQVDGVVLEVLLRKHRAIRKTLGVSVPIPGDTGQVIAAIFEGLLLRGGAKADSVQLGLFGDAYLGRKRVELYTEWEAAEARERVSRTLFAQHGIKVEDVAAELAAVRDALGSPAEVRRFFIDCMRQTGAITQSTLAPDAESVEVSLRDQHRALREAMRLSAPLAAGVRPFRARFALPTAAGEEYLHRTHPCLSGLAAYVLERALDQDGDGAMAALASRTGVIATRSVSIRTTLLLTIDIRIAEIAEQIGRIAQEIEHIPSKKKQILREIKLLNNDIPLLLRDDFLKDEPSCPACEVRIDEVKLKGCIMSKESTQLDKLKERKAAIDEAISNCREELSMLDSLKRDKDAELRSQQQERQDRIIEKNRLDHEFRQRQKMELQAESSVEELDALYAKLDTLEGSLRSTISRLDTLKAQREGQRERERAGLTLLIQRFQETIRGLLGGSASGELKDHVDGFDLRIRTDSERSSLAFDSLKVIAFDIAAMMLAAEGQAFLPGLLIHDSPREADLGQSVYHNLFQFMLKLEQQCKGEVPFQYIVTTTSQPPLEVCQEPYLVQTLNGAEESGRLLRKNLRNQG